LTIGILNVSLEKNKSIMKREKLDLSIPKNRIIVALDVNTLEEVKHWVEILHPYVGMFKIGFELIHSVGGPQAVQVVHDAGGRVFYDCKLHDIPETMKKASKSIADMGVEIFNVHASAGMEAVQKVSEVKGDSALSVVTILTSMDEDECLSIYNSTIEATVLSFFHQLNNLADYMICSPKEAAIVKRYNNEFGKMFNFKTITPGIRPLWAVDNDQNPDRIMTPKKAILAGCDLLVIGRPILQPPSEIGDSIKAAQMIADEIAEALKELDVNA
jgi:orotidine-5'-phosphate decarboxylase